MKKKENKSDTADFFDRIPPVGSLVALQSLLGQHQSIWHDLGIVVGGCKNDANVITVITSSLKCVSYHYSWFLLIYACPALQIKRK